MLRTIRGKSQVWIATTKYYCEYFAIYALLMKIGIKSEIHDCSIAVCHLLETEGIIPKKYTKILEQDKQLRIDNQYYLKNKEVIVDYDKLVEYVLTIKNIFSTITQEKINQIRNKIKSF